MTPHSFFCSHSDYPGLSGDGNAGTEGRWKSWLTFSIVAAVWSLTVLIVNPVGEFMTNDDWSFVRIVEALNAGQSMIATGWGPGGPSAIVHVLWGRLFTDLFGFSVTGLRVAALCAGITGSMVLLIALRHAGVSHSLALLGTLTAVLNPLFLSQCFTFMTDITFACLVASSALFLIIGMERASRTFLAIGLMLSLASILTRQIGIVLPIGLLMTFWLHPAGRKLGLGKIVLMIVAIVLIPWTAYEYYLAVIGSTPLTNHAVIHNIWRYPLEKGLVGYVFSLWDHFIYYGLGYTCFFISPLLLLRVGEIWKFRAFRYFFLTASTALIFVEALTLTGHLNLSVLLHRNVIFDFGIGPILLKDTYILGIPRTFTLPKPIYIIMVYWAALAVAAFLCLVTSFAVRLFRPGLNGEDSPPNLLSTLCIVVSAVYLAIITLTGFHDRYLIPVCLLLTVWVLSDRPANRRYPNPWKTYIPAIVAFLSLAALSVAGVRDFMEMKRAQKTALVYVEESLGTAPCDFDGGFEHNGYHCSDPHFVPKEGLSWWWVSREDYLLTLGPLPGYEVIGTFPFERLIGKSGAVYILRGLAGSGPLDSENSPKS
jgi:Dolichyl-phosphate-mannose-protein mannosyltransferase